MQKSSFWTLSPVCPSSTEVTQSIFSSLAACKTATGRADVSYATSYKGFKHFWGLFDVLKVTPLPMCRMHRDAFWHRRNSTGARSVTPSVCSQRFIPEVTKTGDEKRQSRGVCVYEHIHVRERVGTRRTGTTRVKKMAHVHCASHTLPVISFK